MQHTEALKHTQIARRFVQAAARYLNEGDLIQASEKLWGATAHAVKVYCLYRGWRHSKYSHLRRAMAQVAEETGDESWIDNFRMAYEHHLNFYSDGMPPQDIEGDRLVVHAFVDRLLVAAWDGER